MKPVVWPLARNSKEYAQLLRNWNAKPIRVPVGFGLFAPGLINQVERGEPGLPNYAEITGITVQMWHAKNASISCEEVIQATKMDPTLGIKWEDVLKVAKRVGKKALKQCQHQNAVFVRMAARCLREFKCPSCGAVFQVDSSG